MPEWPKPPMWPEGLPKISELLTAEEYEALLNHVPPYRSPARTHAIPNNMIAPNTFPRDSGH